MEGKYALVFGIMSDKIFYLVRFFSLLYSSVSIVSITKAGMLTEICQFSPAYI